MLARRLDLEVEFVDFPNHMLCRIFEDGCPLIIDCYDKGALHFHETLLEDPDLKGPKRKILRAAAGPDTLLLRLLETLAEDLGEAGRHEDAGLIAKLRSSLA